MNILIIEDEADLRHTLQDLLEVNGYTVITAADGMEGIEQAKTKPDFIFCDVAMPRMDGYATIEAIRQLPQARDIPFVFLTAKTERSDQRRGMDLGADDYITKPFTEQEILKAIKARTTRHQTVHEKLEKLITLRRLEVRALWSHELLTPLNALIGCLALLEEDKDVCSKPENQELLATMRIAANQQELLSRKLIRYFELERLRESPPRDPPNLCSAVLAVKSGALKATQGNNREPDLQIRLADAVLGLHEEHLSYAVFEVVRNACKFSQPGSLITVTGLRHELRYHIIIEDQGPGMSAEQRAGVGAFVQFNRSRLEQQGLGLGLAIANMTAQIVGGQLHLDEASTGHGLKVCFDLPLVKV